MLQHINFKIRKIRIHSNQRGGDNVVTWLGDVILPSFQSIPVWNQRCQLQHPNTSQLKQMKSTLKIPTELDIRQETSIFDLFKFHDLSFQIPRKRLKEAERSWKRPSIYLYNHRQRLSYVNKPVGYRFVQFWHGSCFNHQVCYVDIFSAFHWQFQSILIGFCNLQCQTRAESYRNVGI